MLRVSNSSVLLTSIQDDGDYEKSYSGRISINGLLSQDGSDRGSGDQEFKDMTLEIAQMKRLSNSSASGMSFKQSERSKQKDSESMGFIMPLSLANLQNHATKDN